MQYKYIIGHKYVSTEWHGWLSVMLSERGQVAEIKIVHLYKILEQAKQVHVEKKKRKVVASMMKTLWKRTWGNFLSDRIVCLGSLGFTVFTLYLNKKINWILKSEALLKPVLYDSPEA